MISRNQAATLQPGTTLYHLPEYNTKGSPHRCRVNGRCTTWKTRPTEFRLPVKFGFRTSFYITETNAHEWSLEAPSNV